MAVSLTTLLPPTRSGRTLFVSSSLLGAVALLQMGMLCWHLLRRSDRPTSEAGLIHFAETVEPSTSATDFPYHRDPLTADPSASAAVTLSNVGSAQLSTATGIERPTPAPPERLPSADLLEQARLLRQNGDANTALAKLRQAQISDPNNPQIIAELGITYEAMQLTDRAFEQWQRLYNMGDAVGALYYLADAKLHSAPAAPPAGGPDATGTGRDAAGFQDSAVLKITDIHSEEEQDPAAEKKIVLKIVVKNRPGSAIDPKKVTIHTYFYDLLDGKDVVQTDAQTGYAWLTAPVNWANDESEVLATTYFRALAAPPVATAVVSPTPDGSRRGRRGKGHTGEAAVDTTPAPPAPAPVRRYFGYTVRLYYDRQLQDVQADPLRLLQQFPPPLTLSDQ